MLSLNHCQKRNSSNGNELHHRYSHLYKWRDRFAAIPFEDKSGTGEARYYQHNAIKHVLEAIAHSFPTNFSSNAGHA